MSIWKTIIESLSNKPKVIQHEVFGEMTRYGEYFDGVVELPDFDKPISLHLANKDNEPTQEQIQFFLRMKAEFYLWHSTNIKRFVMEEKKNWGRNLVICSFDDFFTPFQFLISDGQSSPMYWEVIYRAKHDYLPFKLMMSGNKPTRLELCHDDDIKASYYWQA